MVSHAFTWPFSGGGIAQGCKSSHCSKHPMSFPDFLSQRMFDVFPGKTADLRIKLTIPSGLRKVEICSFQFVWGRTFISCFKNIYFYFVSIHWCFVCMYVYVIVSYPVELELQTIVSHHVGVRNWILVLCKSSELSYRDFSPSLRDLIFKMTFLINNNSHIPKFPLAHMSASSLCCVAGAK